MFCLSTADISKVFAHKKALDKVSLSIRSGSIHALLGENGAGKSTLASIISGSQRPSSGSILLGTNPYVTESVTTKTVSFFSPQDAQDKGWLFVGDTIADVAKAADLPYLEATVKEYDEMAKAGDLKGLEKLRVQYLGKKGRITTLMRSINQLPVSSNF